MIYWTDSYNRVNGTHASENPYLIQDILRKEWGSDALVMSDWYVVVIRLMSICSPEPGQVRSLLYRPFYQRWSRPRDAWNEQMENVGPHEPLVRFLFSDHARKLMSLSYGG